MLHAESGSDEVISHLARDSQRVARDTSIVLHHTVDNDALARRDQVSLDGAVDRDGATESHQIPLDDTLQTELTGAYVKVILDYLIGLNDDHIAAAPLEGPHARHNHDTHQQN